MSEEWMGRALEHIENLEDVLETYSAVHGRPSAELLCIMVEQFSIFAGASRYLPEDVATAMSSLQREINSRMMYLVAALPKELPKRPLEEEKKKYYESASLFETMGMRHLRFCKEELE